MGEKERYRRQELEYHRMLGNAILIIIYVGTAATVITLLLFFAGFVP